MPHSWNGGRRFSDRMAAVLAMIASGDAAAPDPEVARASALALGVTGIGVRVATGPIADGTDGGGEPVWFSGPLLAALDHLELTLGEGPGIDAAAGSVALAADLATESRWPMFGAAACELGVRASFAFPLGIGAIHVGVLVAYRTTPGPLTDQQLIDAWVFADAITLVLLNASALDPPTAPRWVLGSAGLERARIHQATGMISVQLAVSLAEALVRLRAYAFSSERPIDDVAADVVAGRLRFDT